MTPWNISRGTRCIVLLILAAILLPAAYLAYVLYVVPLVVGPTTLQPVSTKYLFVYIVILAEIGVVLAGGWEWGLRIAPVLTIVALLGRPLIVPIRSIGLLGQVAAPFVFMMVVTAVEAATRFPDRTGRFMVVDAAGGAALGVGLLHVFLGLLLQVYVRRLYWLDASLPGILLAPVVYAIAGAGLFATGAIPVILWSRNRLLTPGLLTIGWFLWGVYGIWTRSGIPLSEFSGINWIALKPHPDYMLQWMMLLVGILFLTGCEFAIHRGGHRILQWVSGPKRTRRIR